MSSVDDRIVNMKFQNSQFKQGVSETRRDLTGLEQTLQNAGKSKGMTQLASSTQQVTTKFSALQVAGVAALSTIVAKATSAGLRMVKSFTLGPIIDGFKEYQTNLQSIQTIMANTGKGIKPVNKTLQELNEYSDQTIYNFSEMARNIGTFTAAGVKLGQATSAIKGISNLAALSGSSSEQASRAMYQLSQAIAAGRVNLQDWNSVVNAGMGGKQFKVALARTAVAMGKVSAGAVKVGTDVTVMGKTFRESISAKSGDAWLSSDVLVKTLAQLDGRFSETRMKVEGYNKAGVRRNMILQERLKLEKKGIKYSDEEFKKMLKMADAAYAAATQIKTFPQLMDVVKESIGSMWANAFSLIIGDFNQSKKLWGAVGDAIVGTNGILSKISSSFLGTLRGWAEAGGRKEIIQGLSNVFGSLLKIVYKVGEAFRMVFPPGASNVLYKMSVGFRKFTDALVPSEKTLNNLRSIFAALFAPIHLVLTVVKGLVSGFSAFFGALFSSSEGTRSGILSVVAAAADAVVAFERWLTSGGKIQKFLAGIGQLAGTALAPIVGVISLIADGIGSLISGEGLGAAMGSLDKAKSIFMSFFGDLITALDNITAPLDPLKEKIYNFAMRFQEPFETLVDKLAGVRDSLARGLGVDSIGEAFNTAKNKVVDFANSIDLAAIPFEKIGSFIAAAVLKIKEFVDNLDIGDKLASIKDSVSGFFDGLFGDDAGSSGAKAATQAAEATGSAFEKLGSIISVIGGAIKATLGFISGIIGSMFNALSDIPFPDDALEWATVLNALISGALIKRLLFSKGLFSTLKETLKEVGESVKTSFGQLTDTLKTMQTAVKAQAIKNIAIAVALIAASLIALSFVPMEKLAVGIGAIGALMGALTLMVKALMGDDKLKPKFLAAQAAAISAVGTTMVALATSIAILTAAVLALAFIPLEKLAQGMASVAILMGLMVASMMALSKNVEKTAAAAAAMVLMATAINILVGAILILGFIPFETMAQGLIGVAVGIGIMVLALSVLSQNTEKVLGAGAAMVMMATAMAIVTSAVLALAFIPFENLVQGLFGIAAGIGIMTVALLLLSGNSVGVMAAGAAMLMMATSLNILMITIIGFGSVPWEVLKQGLQGMAIALGILLVAAAAAMPLAPGLAALSATILAMGAAMLMAGTGVFLFASGLALLAAVGAAAIAVITAAIGAFILLLPNIAIQVAAAFVSFLQAIALAAPKIRKAFATILRNMLGTITDILPDIKRTFEKLVDLGLGVLVSSANDFHNAGLDIIMNFLSALDKKLPDIIDKAGDVAASFIRGLGAQADKLAKAGEDALIDVLNGISRAIERSDKIRKAAKNVATTFADELREMFGSLLGKINPINYLPSISMSDVRSLLPGPARKFFSRSTSIMPGGRRGGSPTRQTANQRLNTNLAKALNNSSVAIAAAVQLLTKGLKDAIHSLNITAAKRLQKEAKYSSVTAEVRTQSADVMAEQADKQTQAAQTKMDNARSKKDKKKRAIAVKRAKKGLVAARRARNKARLEQDRALSLQNAAERKQQNADYEEARAQDKLQYRDDAQGLGDSRKQVSTTLADEAQAMSQTAKAKRDEAVRLEKLAKKGGRNAARYRQQARLLRKEAAQDTAMSLQLATQSINAQKDAVEAYVKARKEAALDAIERMAEVKKQDAAEKAEKKWQEDYDKADDETKEKMLAARADESAKKAAAAESAMIAAFTESEALAALIKSGKDVSPEQIESLQKAEESLALAMKARDEAEAESQKIKDLRESMKNSSSGSSDPSSGSITPSRTALEDAAKAVDRYTASVRDIEEAAKAESSAPQFIQNNYSPTALSASEIYRQTNNLISVAEIKMGADS